MAGMLDSEIIPVEVGSSHALWKGGGTKFFRSVTSKEMMPRASSAVEVAKKET